MRFCDNLIISCLDVATNFFEKLAYKQICFLPAPRTAVTRPATDTLAQLAPQPAILLARL